MRCYDLGSVLNTSSKGVVVVVLNPGHNGGHQLLQLLGPQPSRLQHFLVVGFLLTVVVHHGLVADQGHGEAAHPSVVGYDDLMSSAHSCRGHR